MAETKFMWQGGRKIPIEADPSEVALHASDELEARAITREAGVTQRALRPLSAGLVRAELPDRNADMAKLRSADHVVHHVYRAAVDNQSELLITESSFLKFKPETSVAAIHQYLSAEHLVVEQDLGDKTFLVRVTTDTGKNPVRTANATAERQDVEYAEPNLVRQLQRMFTPVDPLFVKQWHLEPVIYPKMTDSPWR